VKVRASVVAAVLSASLFVTGCRTPPAPPSPAAQASAPVPVSVAGGTGPVTSPKMAGARARDVPTSSPNAPPARVDAPVVPPSPAYDLAADHLARLKEARTELGPRVPSQVVGDVFLVVAAPGWEGAPFTQSVGLVKSALGAYFTGRFRAHPARAISVYLFPSAAPYEAYCKAKYGEKCLSKYGFYRPDERRMVMNAGLGLGTLTHELVHPIVETDFPQAPAWINEGIASLFEAPVIPRAGEIHGAKNWRHPRLLQAQASASERQVARLDALFGMSDDVFRDDTEDLHYAMARYVCQWLDERGKLWAFYQAWRDGADDDPTGVRAFAAVMGKPPSELNETWSKWVRSL
jgi:hypothetical protein